MRYSSVHEVQISQSESCEQRTSALTGEAGGDSGGESFQSPLISVANTSACSKKFGGKQTICGISSVRKKLSREIGAGGSPLSTQCRQRCVGAGSCGAPSSSLLQQQAWSSESQVVVAQQPPSSEVRAITWQQHRGSHKATSTEAIFCARQDITGTIGCPDQRCQGGTGLHSLRASFVPDGRDPRRGVLHHGLAPSRLASAAVIDR